MSKSKSGAKPPRAKADLAALLAGARDRLEQDGTIKLSSVGPSALRPQLVSRLVADGYEATKTALRKPLEAQLAQALADGAFVSLKAVTSHVVGATSSEGKAAALRLVAEGTAKLVLRGVEEVVVPSRTSTLGRDELNQLTRLVKQVTKAAHAKSGATLLRSDVMDELAPLIQSARSHDGQQQRVSTNHAVRSKDGSTLTQLLSAVDATRDASTGLSFVPAIVAKLKAEYEPSRVTAALLEAARKGWVELRPEGGINRLSDEELLHCPPGPQGTRLSWARRLDGEIR
jgi:hypothetical protein